jgi:hypothetical protein
VKKMPGYTFALVLILWIIASCSTSTSPSGFTVHVELSMQSTGGSSIVSAIDSVSLRVSANDINPIFRSLTIAAGKAEISLDVPPGRDRRFEMDAYDTMGRVLYAGDTTVDIGQGVGQSVAIAMKPQLLLMRLSPSYVEMNARMQAAADVWIFGVDALFGAAFRIEYDANIIRVDSAHAGDFLGTDVLWYANFDDDDSLCVMSISRIGQQGQGTGISGDGKLARIFFTPVVPGKAEIVLDIERGGAPALSKPDLTPVDHLDSLVLEGLTVIVKGS